MHRGSASIGYLCLLVVVLYAGLAAAAGEVVINELYVNTADYFDGSEYIELYNTTGSPIDLEGWVLTSTEYDETCGEHHHVIPAGITIGAHDYIIIVRDATNSDSNGFKERFPGVTVDVEMYDDSTLAGGTTYDIDDLSVPNTICQNPDAYDNQIRFYPGNSDYGYRCSAVYPYYRYEVLYLYDSISRTNLIDAVEYRESGCTADQCAVNGANDAYPRYPDAGISLGRDPSSTDTDTSYIDLHEAYPTPRAQNTLNTPPDVWALNYSPCVPMDDDSVEITCYATDDDGMALVECYYSVRVPEDYTPTAFTNVQMWPTIGEDSLYHVNIAPQDSAYQVKFYVKATDNLNATTTYPGDAPDGAYSYSVDITPISVIQSNRDAGGDLSKFVGDAKNIRGIVTAGRGTYSDYTFIVQDASGPWSGIAVYDGSASVPAQRGDYVEISGFVSEYFNMTELYMFSGCYNELGEGYPVPAPVTVNSGDLGTLAAGVERYEAVLVRVEPAPVTNDTLPYGEWEINDGSGPCLVGDYGQYSYVPVAGDTLDAVQGVLYYSYEDFKIEPRDDNDIEGPVALYDLVYAPHAPTPADDITVSCVVLSDATLTSVKLFYSTTGGAPFDSTSMSNVDSLYSAVIGPYADNTVVDYYVEAWDDQGETGRKPIGGTYDFRVGLKTIYEVQYVTGGQDSSSYAGEPVSVSGIVTAGTGEYSYYYFMIQNSYGGPDTPHFDGVKVYDRTGSVVVDRGDSVTISGDVYENFGETEIAMFFPEAITVHSTGNYIPAYTVTPTNVSTSESLEGVLVRVGNVQVADDDLGYGEWMVAAVGTPGDSCRVDDDAYYTYTPTLGQTLGYVYGTVMYSFNRYKIEPRDDDDICQTPEAGIDDGNIPDKVMMMVKPNPMLDGGTVKFSLPVSGRVSLKAYDVQGRLVRQLADRHMEAGSHRIDWNGTNDQGNRVTSGIYFMRLETARGSVVNKVVVSK